MNDDYKYEQDTKLDEQSQENTYRLVEESYKRDRRTYDEPSYNYDNGYYEDKNRYDSNYKNEKKSKGRGSLVVLALVFSIIGSLIGGAFGAKLAYDRYKIDYTTAGTTPPSYTINTKDEVTTVSAVATANLDSVVGITTTTIMRDIFNRQVGAQAMGSGFIVNENGYIMTNDHVIASLTSDTGYSSGGGYADQVAVVLNDGSQLPAEILWSDSTLDLAILKVEPEVPLKAVKLGNSDELLIGEQAIAIGNPFALEFHGTVTAGYISGLNRTLRGQGTTMQDLIQTDASINQGNSGGPLLNGKGEVIGINTMKISSGEGLGFAIPVNTAKPIIEQVIKTGTFERVTLGITLMDLERFEELYKVDLAPDNGVIILEVVSGSPANKADLQVNDVLTKIGGDEIKNVTDLQNKLTKYNFGDTVELEYVRNRETNKVDVTFESYN
ncbi:MAG: PDZ domain-containing protein [Tissierellia bacterium]|nr:PDZ domain-containing protein [Tissierellia bacterium]